MKLPEQLTLIRTENYHRVVQVLSTHGDFLFGIHQGENVHEVAQTDIAYIRSVLARTDIDSHDREVLNHVLRLTTEA